jgi:hypothetical protein
MEDSYMQAHSLYAFPGQVQCLLGANYLQVNQAHHSKLATHPWSQKAPENADLSYKQNFNPLNLMNSVMINKHSSLDIVSYQTIRECHLSLS